MMMKHVFFAALACLLAACSSDNGEERVNGKKTVDVVLTFPQFTVTHEEMTRDLVDVSTIATRIDVWAVSGDDVVTAHQTSSDDAFGTVMLSLDPTKTYTVYAVAHKASGQATLTDGIIAWPDDKVTQTFYYTASVNAGTTSALSCTMSRIVGMFRVETTDAVPADVTKFRFLIPQTFSRWSVTDGGTNAVDRTTDVAVTSTRQDGTVAVSIYLVGADDEAHYNITIQALDAQNDVIRERTFANVPIRNNYKTTMTGAFFASKAMRMTFMADDWQTYAVVNF